MKKIKTGMLLLAVVLLSASVKAQNIDEGKQFLYYERYQSAKTVLEKLVAANPNDVEAVYWLGQAMIQPDDKTPKDVADAKALYQKTLMANSNSALLLAGMGHIELIENKPQDARNHFETALSLSQNKDAAVLNAVGFANVNSKNGDAAYAVAKLTIATEIKKMNNPDVYVNLGDAYKILGDGGKAQIAYEAALALNAKYARAPYRIGKIYQTQGIAQEDIYMRYYLQAMQLDPAYAPVYENLYNFYYTTNVPKSAEYLDKYLANSDDNPKGCYLRASILYAEALFAQAITKADECIGAKADPYPKLYGIKAYAYNKLGDSAKSRASFEQYFKEADSSVIGSGDYATYASVLIRFQGNDSIAAIYVEKAIALDTLEANKINYIKNMAGYYELKKEYKNAGDWYKKLLTVKKDPGKFDFYNAGYNYFRSGYYETAIPIFDSYSQKYPDDAFGYYMSAKSKWGIDTTMTLAMANPDFDKAIAVGVVDSVKYQPQLIGSYKYFVAYYANVMRDNETAIAYCDKILALDPTDAEATNNKLALQAASAPKQPKPAKQSKGAASSK